MTTYAWVPGSPFRADANEVKAELDRIERTGGLTPEAVVIAARPKRSVLHSLIFDGTTAEEALEKYYLGRARTLIKVIVEVQEEEPTSVRAFARVVTDDGARWKSTELPDVREHEVRRLRGVLRGVKRQLDDLEIYPNVAMAIEEALVDDLVTA